MVASIAAIFSADLYFVLLPKLQSMGHGSEHSCSCESSNFTSSKRGGPRIISNWTSPGPVNGATPEPADGSSKLERLFAHPLYDIQILELSPEEKLLEAEQLMEYYRRKVSRWERSVSRVAFPQI